MGETIDRPMTIIQARQLLRNTSKVPDDRVAGAERIVRAFFAAKPRRQCIACPSCIWTEHETKSGGDVCWACARCHLSADLTAEDLRVRQAEQQAATAAAAVEATAAAQPKPRTVLRERLAALATARIALEKLEKAAPAARSRVWDLQARVEAAEAAAEEANTGAASGLAEALAEGKSVEPSSAGAKARAALADAADELSVAKSARTIVEERLSSAKSEVDFTFDKCRKSARAVIASERMEDLLTSATEARAEYIDALGSIAWLAQQNTIPDGDARPRQLLSDANTPPSSLSELTRRGIGR